MLSKIIQDKIKLDLYNQYYYTNRNVSFQFYKDYININIKTPIVNINYINNFINSNQYLRNKKYNIIIKRKKYGHNK